MLLSKRTQYGIRALVCLAENYERGYVQAGELARREKLPLKFLESILNALARSNFLISKIGAAGGYRLARPPKEITLGGIVARLEGRRLMQTQPAAHPGERPGESAVRLVHAHLTDAVRKVLDNTSLADLAEQVAAQASEGQMYFI
jgi:Rrf2 family transcriptional regulator, cysteine metabolism repressor